MNCPKCQTVNPADAKFCRVCANPLAPSQPVVVPAPVAAPVAVNAMIACPACNAPNKPGVRFCNKCGKPMAGPVVAAAAAPQPGAQPQPQGVFAAPQQMQYPPQPGPYPQQQVQYPPQAGPYPIQDQTALGLPQAGNYGAPLQPGNYESSPSTLPAAQIPFQPMPPVPASFIQNPVAKKGVLLGALAMLSLCCCGFFASLLVCRLPSGLCNTVAGAFIVTPTPTVALPPLPGTAVPTATVTPPPGTAVPTATVTPPPKTAVPTATVTPPSKQ